MNPKVRAALDLKSKLLDRYADDLIGVLGCYDRLIITGMLVDVGHPDVMAAQLRHLNIRCFDLGVFAEPLRDQVRDNAILLGYPDTTQDVHIFSERSAENGRRIVAGAHLRFF